jgi:small subunit ribosomal protein S33
LQLQCSIFSNTFNPNQQRLGNKILRQRLRGPALAAYYPRRSATVEDMLEEFKRFDLEGFNEAEEDRLENIQIAKLRGKGAPKKKRTAAGRIIRARAHLPGRKANNSSRQSAEERQEEVTNWFGDDFETCCTLLQKDTQYKTALADAGPSSGPETRIAFKT